MADFAEHGDVVTRWRPFRDDAERDIATERLGDASAFLRLLVPGLQARVDADPDVARAAKATVVEAVRRYLRNPDGAKSVQETINERAYGLTFEGRATGIFFTEDELSPLRPTPAGTAPPIAFSASYRR